MSPVQFKTEAFMSTGQWALLIGFCTVLVLVALIVVNRSKKLTSQLGDKTENAALCQVTSKKLSRTLTIHSIEKNGSFATVLESEKNIIQLTFHETEQQKKEKNEPK